MPAELPRIDPRSRDDIVAEVEASLRELTAWRPPATGPDAGGALVRIFARLAELVIERLNRLPEKNFLAFLDLIGARLPPPQPARVPLTFALVPGSPVDARVPAGTQVAAAPLEGEKEPPVFETERDLVLTRTRLVHAFVHEPKRDLYLDATALATGAAQGTFPVFQGDTQDGTRTPIPHRLYLGHRGLLALPEAKVLTLSFMSARPDQPWPPELTWAFWDGGGWKALEADYLPQRPGDGQPWTVTFNGVPAIPEAVFGEALEARFESDFLGDLSGRTTAWLRADLSDLRPPGSSDPVPPLETIRINASVTGDDLLPERSFANREPVDLNKDFLPFGARPRYGDAFYLASDAAFSKADPAVVGSGLTVTRYPVTLQVTRSDLPAELLPHPTRPVELTWEYWNGERWRRVGVSSNASAFLAGSADYPSGLHDGTQAFTRFLEPGPTPVTFNAPGDWRRAEVNGEARYWLRVRISKGNYGEEARFEPVAVPVPDEVAAAAPVPAPADPPPRFIVATFRPPSIRALRIDYDYTASSSPEQVLSENDFTLAVRDPGASFRPFTPAGGDRPALLLGFDRPDDTVGFANRATDLYFALAEPLYGASAGQPTEEAAASEPAAVVWEYWGGAAWKRLGTRDETAGFRHRGLVTFVGPPDFRASFEFGRRAFWLRARLERGGYPVEPLLARVMTNTTWAVHAASVQDETMGSSNGQRDQLFRTSRAPVLPGQALEVREPERPSAAERAEIEAEEGADAVRPIEVAGRR